jgi:APA family basic amino acid/polyamine antiporter
VGYPLVPALYVAATGAILLVLLVYRTQTTWPGLAIVIAGVPVYFLRRGKAAAAPAPGAPEGGAGYR